ncbi:glycosyltransferase family 2 protein [Yeosuana sp.]|uniref:glycosyltransferase family 2 protein n=1 Tax=Yeosuana sp. TaxID=2529388 RepID=UPI004054C398
MIDLVKNKIDYKSIEKVDVSIIIVNYKSWKHLQDCLDSITKISQDRFSYEVIVIDNHSNDNKFDEFYKNHPPFKFFLNSGNNGFSNGCNYGVSKAVGEYFLFLNPDTIVTKDAILKMLQLARENLQYGVISCTKINNVGKPEKEIRFFPKSYTLFGTSRAIYNLINKKKINEVFNSIKSIVFPDWVSGSIIFTSKKWFEKIGGWNEDYWLYLEDVDFCKRISNAEGKVALLRTTKIIHNHGGASRINVKTSALTKAEVIISKHTYIHNHFTGITKFFSQFLLVFFGVITKLVLAIIGSILFFVPKLYMNALLFLNLIRYYINALMTKTWISKRAPNYNK